MHPDSTHTAATFLVAWKVGISTIGEQFFLLPAGGLGAVTRKEHACPNIQHIKDSIDTMSTGQAVFLAAMVSFYNPTHGAAMLKNLGITNPCSLAARLDTTGRGVIAELMCSYSGW